MAAACSLRWQQCLAETVTACPAATVLQGDVASSASEDPDIWQGWLHYAPPPQQVPG